MYSKQEDLFIKYWEEKRKKKKNLVKSILISLPLGIIIVVAIFINFFSGWYKKADMVAHAEPSLFIVLLIAGILIVAFIAIFTSYLKWDRNEAMYKELISRKKEK